MIPGSNVRPWGADPVDIVMADGRIERSRAPAGTAAAGRRAGRRRAACWRCPGFVNAPRARRQELVGPALGLVRRRGRRPRAGSRTSGPSGTRSGSPSVASTTAVLREFLGTGRPPPAPTSTSTSGSGCAASRRSARRWPRWTARSRWRSSRFPQDGVIRRPGVLELLDRRPRRRAHEHRRHRPGVHRPGPGRPSWTPVRDRRATRRRARHPPARRRRARRDSSTS